MLNNILLSSETVGEEGIDFLDKVESALSDLNKGLHFTNWGGVKEWKLPDSFEYEEKTTQRHLSHLTGYYPGNSVSSYQGGCTNKIIQDFLTKL